MGIDTPAALGGKERGSGKVSEQFCGLDRKRLRQLDDVLQGDITLAPLHPADVVPV